MKKILLAVAALALAAPVAAAVSYDFTAYDFNGQSIGGFTVTTPDFVTGTLNAPTVISAAQFDSCTLVGGCGDASFFHDPGFLPGPGKDVLAFGGPTIAAFYFFAGGSFSTPGDYTPANSDIPTPTGRLLVLQGIPLVINPVPEPGEWASLTAGLGIVGLLARRARRRKGSAA